MGQIKRQLGSNPPPRHLVPIERIVEGLNARLYELCRQLLPAGHREFDEYVEARRKNGGLGDSLRVNLKKGVWKHFSGTGAGDALDLVAYLQFGGDKGQAVRWALSWLGLDGQDPQRLQATRRAVETKPVIDVEAETRKRRNGAWHMYLSAQELSRAAEPIVETYLRGRGIDLRVLPRYPGSIRYSAELWNAEAQRKFPAMVAAIVNHEGDFRAVHRTWLAPSPDGGVAKAPLRDAKMTYGSYAGGAIHIWRGSSGKPLRQAPEGSTLDITEGIEDALTVATAMPELRVWAAVSLSNIQNLVLPPAIARVRLWTQNDAPGSPAALALDRAVAALLQQGKRVKLARPPQGVKDVNDLVRGE